MERPQYTRDDLVETLRAHGINPTHQRIEIAHALYSRCEHLCADQVLAIVNERHPETSRATVYNTLNLFVQKELLRELHLAPDSVVFDPNMDRHHHLIDEESGRIHDIPWNQVEVRKIAGISDFEVSDYQVVMHGHRRKQE